MTQIILLERVARLGGMGDTVNVRPGFARNFLIPQGKALPATEANRAKFEAKRQELEASNAQRAEAAKALAAKMDGVSVLLARQSSETGALYGSVKARDVAAALTAQGLNVETDMVQIGEPIRSVGEFSVKVAFHADVVVSVPVTVERQTA